MRHQTAHFRTRCISVLARPHQPQWVISTLINKGNSYLFLRRPALSDWIRPGCKNGSISQVISVGEHRNCTYPRESKSERMDNITPERRSAIMRKVKSKNTSPELSIRRLIYQLGFRYRLHCKDLPGKPDIMFWGKKKLIFVHGCFWHGHIGCKRSRIPSSNRYYWTLKIDRNIFRDKRNQENFENER